jgi:hypothetical protein
MIWKIWKKPKMDKEKIWKILKKIEKKYRGNVSWIAPHRSSSNVTWAVPIYYWGGMVLPVFLLDGGINNNGGLPGSDRRTRWTGRMKSHIIKNRLYWKIGYIEQIVYPYQHINYILVILSLSCNEKISRHLLQFHYTCTRL